MQGGVFFRYSRCLLVSKGDDGVNFVVGVTDSLEQILGKVFRRRAKVVLADGTETPEAPEVTPPMFIEVVKKVIQNFGNMGESEVCVLCEHRNAPALGKSLGVQYSEC